MSTELEVALGNEPAPAELPIGLPLAHLTVCRWLQPILKVGRLEPRLCKTFSKNLLYFSYGGVFYRSSNLQTEHASELPIGLVFSPIVMNAISRLFPFDSGAMARDMFGPDWRDRLAPFESRFSVNTKDALNDARRLVYHLFETNPRYLNGHASNSGKYKRAPLPLLQEFLASDLSSLNVDHRQRTVEAISEVAFEVGKHLLWVGIPQRKFSTVAKGLYRWTAPDVPSIQTYDFTKNFNPSQLSAILEDKAREYVIERYASLSL
jgi:hypothetical protein